MTALEECISLQTQMMSAISRALPNFKKLGQAKKTQATTQQRLTSLKESFSKCQELDGKIHRLADDKTKSSHEYFLKKQFIECEDRYDETSDYLAEVLATYQPIQPHHSGNISLPSESGGSLSSHLPKINLPTFDGSFDKWESFRDKFKSIIHNDTSLSDLKRLHYLCSCLTGEASTALNDIDLIETNFTLAWNRLVSRYENKRKLITCHLKSLLHLPVVTSESAQDLRNLRDQINKAIHSLKGLGRHVDYWDDILVFLVSQNLDKSTKKAWELKLGKATEYPTYSELDEFLESRICGLESITLINQKDCAKSTKIKTVASHSATTSSLSCPKCKANHLLYQCSVFIAQTPSKRFEFIKYSKRCINCLSAKHSVKDCISSRTCKQCHKKHHTLLHFDNAKLPDAEQPSAVVSNDPLVNATISSHILLRSVAPKSEILLATARVRVYSPYGHFVKVRALLDQGSASTLISETLVQSLRLSKTKQSVFITGIGETQSVVRHATQISITPVKCDGPAYSTTALILKTLTKYTPCRITTRCNWKHLTGLELADGELMSSDPIDIIIGADLIGMLLLEGVRKGSENEPVAQKTTLGWILSGPATLKSNDSASTVHIHHGTVFDNLDCAIRRFWEVEDVPLTSTMSPEESQSEQHFLDTHSHRPDGRYIVRLPFKSGSPIQLGESRFAALQSLRRLEQRFQRKSGEASEYARFLLEYEHLGHMAKLAESEVAVENSQFYYIPHHAVVRDSSATTRLRVVFNASCRTSNGASLNDYLLIGPKLQIDLATVIMRWRQYQYVYTADIAKMYRQILIDSRDADYQRILWRCSPGAAVDEYRLLTVTYGTASAPYLALRVLKQLISDEGASYPLATPVLNHQTYVDDCTFGAADKSLLLQIRSQLIDLLSKGGFRLRKWASNCPDLLADINPEDHGLACDKDLQADESIKVLGIAWNPNLDIFHFRVSIGVNPGKTKREILSTMAKFYDPLGWVTPVTVTAKIFMQQLWSLKCDWDDQPPSQYLDQWLCYHSKLPCLEDIKLPRWTTYRPTTTRQELHGFSDASTKATISSPCSRRRLRYHLSPRCEI